MSTANIEPVKSLPRSLPEMGRIRFGDKIATQAGAERPRALHTFRFTSQDKAAIETIAELYGGKPSAWDEPKAAPHQWQVTTTSNEIAIVLPGDALGNSPIYELWGGSGHAERRCDGSESSTACTVAIRRGDDLDRVDRPCVCREQGALACKPKTRLNVVVPEVPFGGTWRLDTSSWNAARELPQMVRFIQSLQVQDRASGLNLVRGVLTLKHDRSDGGRKKFVYPALKLRESFDEILAGAAQVSALGAASHSQRLAAPDAPALGGGGDVPDDDPDEEAAIEGEVVDVPDDPPAAPVDNVVDAEVIDDPGAPGAPDWREAAQGAGLSHAQLLRRAREVAAEVGVAVPTTVDAVQQIAAPAFIDRLWAAVYGD